MVTLQGQGHAKVGNPNKKKGHQTSRTTSHQYEMAIQRRKTPQSRSKLSQIKERERDLTLKRVTLTPFHTARKKSNSDEVPSA